MTRVSVSMSVTMRAYDSTVCVCVRRSHTERLVDYTGQIADSICKYLWVIFHLTHHI